MRLAAAEVCGVAAAAPDLVRCLACETIGMAPVPTNDQLAVFYDRYHATDAFLAKAERKVARARRRVRALRLLKPGARTFLDVGASIGTAAEAARRAGLEAFAVEIDEDAVAKGRALFPDVAFTRGTLDDLPAGAAYDLLYGAEVIEHVPDPLGFARRLFERTAPGGLLYLTTPDAGHPRRPRRLLDWHSVKPPEHVTLFTRSGLRALLCRAGYDRVVFQPYLKPGIRAVARRGRR
ncbi:class I SAM-dependent methyltransferase [Parvularcula dongshanensis]|uniref:SAM-dependent methyltransferase n=1 Tax=Parvularcula dongshanensis TaxID=1173995 RepID=A0A840I2L9_9PROT|nr:class I SAM-dependent methyltransferase [Parvularcula dongshanensis]MBB4658987.1 SAM-dependent methyltransferase [Parvularcula dongshanensis]